MCCELTLRVGRQRCCGAVCWTRLPNAAALRRMCTRAVFEEADEYSWDRVYTVIHIEKSGGTAGSGRKWVAASWHFVALHVSQSINYVSPTTVPDGELDDQTNIHVGQENSTEDKIRSVSSQSCDVTGQSLPATIRWSKWSCRSVACLLCFL